jgi:radical SAM protein with 4Fe4S-binding SPASM domain
VRGHPRGYELAVDGIARVLAGRCSKRQPFVQVSCALTSQTQANLIHFVELMGELGVDRILFNGLIYATNDQIEAQQEILRVLYGVSHCEAEALNTSEQHHLDVSLLQQQIEAIQAGPWRDRVVFSPPGMVEHLADFYAPGAEAFPGQQCTAVHRELWVLPNGDVGACVHINEIKMGNVRAEGIRSAWNSPAFRQFRQQLGRQLLPICARCEKLSYRQPGAKLP